MRISPHQLTNYQRGQRAMSRQSAVGLAAEPQQFHRCPERNIRSNAVFVITLLSNSANP